MIHSKYIKGFITNLGLYNEGELAGEWIEFPITNEKMQEVFKRIGVDERHEEVFFTDFDCNIYGLSQCLGEYTEINLLNILATKLEKLDEHDFEKFNAILESGISLREDGIMSLIGLTENLDCYEILPGVTDECEYGQYIFENFIGPYIEENVIDEGIRTQLELYFNYESCGRDAQINDNGMFSDYGYIIDNGSKYYPVTEKEAVDLLPDEYNILMPGGGGCWNQGRGR